MAWTEPSSGLEWEVATYYDDSAAAAQTLASGVLPTSTPLQIERVPPVPSRPPSSIPLSEKLNHVIQYESVAVNTGIPDTRFSFSPMRDPGPGNLEVRGLGRVKKS